MARTLPPRSGAAPGPAILPAMSKSAPAAAPTGLRNAVAAYLAEAARIEQGGGPSGIERQHRHGRLTARERIERLVDPRSDQMELGLLAAWGMYREYGGAPAAGVVTTIGVVAGKPAMIIANDATVKAGAFFPMTCKKIIRAQVVAERARLPLIYLVDSAGVFLPLQEDVFPDTDDFGRIFRNNAVFSAKGIPQIAAIMGNCVAGGGYLPVLCDTLLMTEGSGLYLAGPALVKAAIGQEVGNEELGGARMHAEISGTIDFREADDPACIGRLRRLMEANQAAPALAAPPFAPALQGEIASLNQQGLVEIADIDYYKSHIDDIRIISNSQLEVDTCEVWSLQYYRRSDGALVQSNEPKLLPQTIIIQKIQNGWFITSVQFFEAPAFCNS